MSSPWVEIIFTLSSYYSGNELVLMEFCIFVNYIYSRKYGHTKKGQFTKKKFKMYRKQIVSPANTLLSLRLSSGHPNTHTSILSSSQPPICSSIYVVSFLPSYNLLFIQSFSKFISMYSTRIYFSFILLLSFSCMFI